MSTEIALDHSKSGPWDGRKLALGATYGKMMMWFFLLSDAFTFSAFLTLYGYYRFSSSTWANPEVVFQSVPLIADKGLPLVFVGIMTFILIASSLTMVLAVEAGHRKDNKTVTKFMVYTVIGGLMFLGCQAYEWNHLLHQGLKLGLSVDDFKYQIDVEHNHHAVEHFAEHRKHYPVLLDGKEISEYEDGELKEADGAILDDNGIAFRDAHGHFIDPAGMKVELPHAHGDHNFDDLKYENEIKAAYANEEIHHWVAERRIFYPVMLEKEGEDPRQIWDANSPDAKASKQYDLPIVDKPVFDKQGVAFMDRNGNYVDPISAGYTAALPDGNTTQFGNLFFFITGFHGFHVFSGVLFLIIILMNVIKGTYIRRGYYEMVEKIGLYWHFVDLVWVFVFTLFYLI